MLQGVEGGVAEQVVSVGAAEAQVQGDHRAVPPGEVHPGLEPGVVDGKAGDSFHIDSLLYVHGRRQGAVERGHGGGQIGLVLLILGRVEQVVGHHPDAAEGHCVS